jgi:HD-GYP domain-containing protein (c-di-GMP phosphodiesterase class II)
MAPADTEERRTPQPDRSRGAPHPPAVFSPAYLRMSDLISALSYALDLTEGQPMGHSVKCCVLGMQLAEICGLPVEERGDLYYALLLKDAGCSSNAARMYEILGGDERKAKSEAKLSDWSSITFEGLEYLLRNVMPGRSRLERLLAIANVAINRDKQAADLIGTRCDRGAQIAQKIGFSEKTYSAIYSLDEHWDGKGFPAGRAGDQIPLFARIMNLCQTFEVFAALNGPDDAYQVLQDRAGTWFDPELVRAAKELKRDVTLWEKLEDRSVRQAVIDLEPVGLILYAEDARLDSVCEAFADVIDVKSPYTHAHSRGVMNAAVHIATQLNFDATTKKMIQRAALLHDIGKLSVPNNILDKPGKLTAQEWDVVQLHPYYTQQILEKIAGFEELAYVASSHHEKLDGTGYFRKLHASQMAMPSRVIAVADVYDALSAKRPYRDALPREEVMRIIGKDVPRALDPECFAALQSLI